MIPRTPSSLPRVAADRGRPNGEGPSWHPQENRLYWVDPEAGSLLCLDPTGRTGAAISAVPDRIRRFVVQADGAFLLFTRDNAVKTWRDGAGATVCSSAPWGHDAVIDCTACDPTGRVYCSVRSAEARSGALFRVDLGGTVAGVPADAACSGGLAFSADGATAYAADAASREILALAVDPASGALRRRAVIARIPESLGVPRGLALDAKGFLWIPLWGGSCVVRLSPAGREERRVYFTARLLSGLAFGGEDGRELFVTSSGGDNRRDNGPAAGALFSVRPPGVKGAAALLSRVGIQPPSKT